MPIDLLTFGEEFHPRKRLAVNAYRLPESIQLKKGKLFWQPAGATRVQPTVATFAGFVNLSEASDEKILAFAERWGPLEFFRAKKGEPCDEWRRLATVAGAVLRISQRHYDGERGRAEDWQILYRMSESNIPILIAAWEIRFGRGGKRDLERKKLGQMWWSSIRHHGLRLEKVLIQIIVNEWLERGQVCPALIGTARYQIILRAEGLFGSLAVQLLELLGRGAISACSGCHKFYFPTIAPKAGQDRYCFKCRETGVPVAAAMHRRNLKRAKERNESKVS